MIRVRGKANHNIQSKISHIIVEVRGLVRLLSGQDALIASRFNGTGSARMQCCLPRSVASMSLRMRQSMRSGSSSGKSVPNLVGRCF